MTLSQSVRQSYCHSVTVSQQKKTVNKNETFRHENIILKVTEYSPTDVGPKA